MVLKGPGFKRLKRLGLAMKDAKKIQVVVAKAQAEEAINLIKQGFADEEDPYGSAWEKRKKREAIGRKQGPRKPPSRKQGPQLPKPFGPRKSAAMKRREKAKRKRSRAGKRKRREGKKILSLTGRMKTGWKVSHASAAGWRVTSSVNYSLPHQDPKRGAGGKLKRPRRMMVPSERLGLPFKWRRGLGVATGDAIREFIGRKIK